MKTLAHEPARVRQELFGYDESIEYDDSTPRFNLVTAFAGKAFCLDHYLRGIKTLPLSSAHVVWYDNSKWYQFAFRKRLRRELAALPCRSWTLVRDTNPSHTVESTDEYEAISWRCHCVYKSIMDSYIFSDLPLTMVVEDDVEIPPETWTRLNAVLADNPQIATVVGSCCSRRLNDRSAGVPIAWNFERTKWIGGSFEERVTSHYLVDEKDYGVELIGSAHMGCWLTRTEVIKKVGMQFGSGGLYANDQSWGYNLNEAGYRMAIDWSVKTCHYYKENGEVKFVRSQKELGPFFSAVGRGPTYPGQRKQQRQRPLPPPVIGW